MKYNVLFMHKSILSAEVAMASGSHGDKRNIKIIASGSRAYDEDYVKKKLARAQQKVAAAMKKMQKANHYVNYDVSSSSDSSSSDDEGIGSSFQGFSNKQGGAKMEIKKQMGDGIANITIGSAKNIQMGDRNVMVINKGGAKPEQKSVAEDVDMPSAQDESSQDLTLTAAQQAVLDSEEVVDDRSLRILSTCIGNPWRRIFRKLELAEEEIEQLHLDYNSQGIQMVIYQGLLKWKRKNGKNACVGKLVKIVFNITKNKEVIDKIGKHG
ncbi:uncharacterized protein LOC132559886 [Ylistrum balloti]|uniref:uncharacterized protein LOC132559886 n=1 Tax=Ylistrum balloti TaxID=509963 RepID=UPI002905E1A8|nr:uncharacterized protein LOC132559886 [Ylistrum balloti]